MREQQIINALLSLNDEEATSVAEAIFIDQSPMGKAVQRYIEANVKFAMIKWAVDDPETVNRFKQVQSDMIQAIVEETVKRLGNSPELPLRAFYSEEQACQFFQKGPQFLKTRRSKGQPVPKHTDTGNGYIYSIAELLKFSDEIGPNYEPVSKDVLMEKGLEAVSLAVGNIGRKIEQRRKSRTPKKE